MADDFSGHAGDDIWVDAWFSIWYKPRATMRRIVDTDPRKFVLLIAWLAGVLGALNGLVTTAVVELPSNVPHLPHLGLLGVMVAAGLIGIAGILGLYGLGSLYRWSGYLLGGTASRVEVRAALAWSQVPGMYLEVVTIVAALLGLYNPPAQHVGLIQAVIGVWFLLISLKCLGEVHRFSAWRALGAIVLGTLAMAAVLIGLVITLWLAIRFGRSML